MLYNNRFFRFFPPPQFLEMPAVGLDISDQSIRFAELKRASHGLVLGKFGEQSISPGIVVEGLIRKHDEMRKILVGMKKKHGFSFVRTSLPEEQGYSLKIEIPRVKPEEIYESLELQLADHVPLSPHEAVFDYQLVTCGVSRSEGNYKVGLSVMPHRVVEGYLKIFENTGLTPLSFEFEAHSIARAIVQRGDCGTFLLLDIGGTRTGVAVQSGGVITFTSTIKVGGHSLTEAVARSLNISFGEAQRRKESEGLLHGKEDPLYRALVARLAILRDEISKHYEYARSHENIIEKGGDAIDRIIICGGEANVPGLPNYLATTLNIDIEIANPWININSLAQYVPEIPSNHALRYATALGLALGTLS
ncbi:MAG: pilus assembly protein PilM [Parcubacteria group bacterium]|nr:pilus assembly protein PilM [Parcubacteria group bacterium]